MSDGIAPKVEPSAASGEVYPSFSKPPFGVGTDVKISCPFSVSQCIGFRIRYPGLGSVMELGFVAQTTVRARNMKHKMILMSDTGRSMFVD